MFTTGSLWFEIAIVSIIFALGNITMGHFEERTPKLKGSANTYSRRYSFVAYLCFWQVRCHDNPGNDCATNTLCSWLLFAKEKRYQWLVRRAKSKYYEFRKWDKDIFSK